MFKVLRIISAFAVLCISAVFCADCLYLSQVWGEADPSLFYYCNPVTNQSEAVTCAEGTGFVNNGTVTGCIPWEDWNDNCVGKVDASTVNCEGDTFTRPFGAGNPGFFYLCPAQNATPVEISCQEGTGFYDKDNYLGCYPWEMWRNITGCVN